MNQAQIDGMTLMQSQSIFTPFALEMLEGRVYQLSDHQEIMCDTLDRVLTGEIKRLIINIPPAYAKTAIAVWSFVSRGYAFNPASKFLHLSYSDVLVNDNSANIRAIINSAEYQRIYPHVQLRIDSKSKGLWKTSAGGAFRAAPSGGAVTGFRAGVLGSKIFAGALIIDDPIKADDANSDVIRNGINQRWENVFRSRLASPDTPVIVIMQRLHEDDFTAHLLNDSNEQWHHLVLPAYIDNTQEYNIKGNGIPIEYELPDGALWDAKYSDEESLALMRDGQYSQNPTAFGGNVIRTEWFRSYTQLPLLQFRMIYADTASKTKESNDYSVISCWGKGKDGMLYLIDIVRGKYEMPDLERVAIAFWNKHKAANVNTHGALRKMGIEDKASGTGLIQSIRRKGSIPVMPIQVNTDKYTRVCDVVGYIESGYVSLPEDASFVSDFISECEAFSKDDSHRYDDQVDNLTMAITDMLGKGRMHINEMALKALS